MPHKHTLLFPSGLITVDARGGEREGRREGGKERGRGEGEREGGGKEREGRAPSNTPFCSHNSAVVCCGKQGRREGGRECCLGFYFTSRGTIF